MARTVKTTADKLQAALDKILKEYEGQIRENAADITKQFAKKGAQAVRSEAKAKGWGETTGYPKGWTSKYEEGRYSMRGIIYNKDNPSLTHLLEKGHALRQGGRTRAFPHVAPVERQLVNEFYKAVKEEV